ncbi:MAG: tRNA (adenosine(37)-N6)-threonylcarbamoyltransferase complex ATPase subunit type 1 TsaE [Candidatus Pacebacteria bacterium]|nr:tRNA (adenosine(37)-N6)-threonylcarbamoyltransferase complex ATPase subunit type 1 TsaE [Candidatus Paceibacterota bacterium]
MKKIIIENLSDLETFAKELLKEILVEDIENNQATVIALSGNLGAGKTTFVQLLAKELGVRDKVTSPTFTIMKGYELSGKFNLLIHMDAYRIEDLNELGPLRFSELLTNKTNLLCIEWAEKIQSALPAEIIKINIEILPDGKREITCN